MSTVSGDGESSPLCSFDCLLHYALDGGGNFIPQWDLEVTVRRLGIFVDYGMTITSDEAFFADSAMAHPGHDMMRKRAAFVYTHSAQLEFMPRQRAEMLDARYEGHKHD